MIDKILMICEYYESLGFAIQHQIIDVTKNDDVNSLYKNGLINKNAIPYILTFFNMFIDSCILESYEEENLRPKMYELEMLQ